MSRPILRFMCAPVAVAFGSLLQGVPLDPDLQPKDNTATLKGNVTYDGSSAPKPADLSVRINEHADKVHCLKGPNAALDRVWVVKNGAVANVAVWVRPVPGQHFLFTEKDKKRWAAEVKVDQPFCHFEPHVSVAFPKYIDSTTNKFIETGQQVKVVNSAPISHNVK